MAQRGSLSMPTLRSSSNIFKLFPHDAILLCYQLFMRISRLHFPNINVPLFRTHIYFNIFPVLAKYFNIKQCKLSHDCSIIYGLYTVAIMSSNILYSNCSIKRRHIFISFSLTEFIRINCCHLTTLFPGQA